MTACCRCGELYIASAKWMLVRHPHHLLRHHHPLIMPLFTIWWLSYKNLRRLYVSQAHRDYLIIIIIHHNRHRQHSKPSALTKKEEERGTLRNRFHHHNEVSLRRLQPHSNWQWICLTTVESHHKTKSIEQCHFSLLIRFLFLDHFFQLLKVGLVVRHNLFYVSIFGVVLLI